MSVEKDSAIMLEGKEGKKDGRREGGWVERRKDGRGKKRTAFLARYKPEAKFAGKFYTYQGMFPTLRSWQPPHHIKH